MMRWVGFTLLSSFFLLLSTLVVVTKKPLCIDSMIVNRIDRVSASGVKTAYTCRENKVVNFDEDLNFLVKEIYEQVHPFEFLFNHGLTSVRFTLLQGMNGISRIQNNEIFMSSDRLKTSTELPRTLIKMWLREHLTQTDIFNTEIETSLVDFIYYIYGPYDYQQKYKQSLGKDLIQAYLQLKIQERRHLSENLLDSLMQIKEYNYREPMTFYSRIPYLEGMYKRQNNTIKVEYLFEVTKLEQFDRTEIQKIFNEGEDKKTSIAVIYENEVWVFNNDNSIALGSIQSLSAHQYIYLNCEAPDYNKIQSISEKSSRLLYVKKCQNQKQVHFSRLFKEGAEGFAKENLDVSFMQIYIPSLRQIWIDQKTNPLQLLAAGRWQDDFFNRSGWQKPIWDESILAYRSQSIVNSIDLFRN